MSNPSPIPTPSPLPDFAQLSISSPSTATQSETQIFHQFPRLPLELRLKIYNHINRLPRIVTIEYKSVFTTPEVEDGQENDGRANLYDRPRGGRRGLFSGRARLAATQKPRYVSRWVSHTPLPAGLGVNREMRAEALKYYTPAFGSLEGSAQIYFNFASDTLYFGNASSIPPLPPSPTSPAAKTTQKDEDKKDAAPYRLDLFLGGDYYGVFTPDFNRIKFLALDIAEELYGRRGFCFEDIRNMASLEKLTLVAWEEVVNGRVAVRSPGARPMSVSDFMQTYKMALQRVWDKYAKGYGEGLVNFDDGKRNGEGKIKQWKIPQIEVWNAHSGKFWGEVELPIDENGV